MTTAYATGLDEVFDRPPDPFVALLTLRDVSVSFGGLAALSGVSLDVGPRDLVAVVGPNRAGKSTTLNAICQLVRSSGDITLKGQPINGAPAWRVAARGIGRSFQDPPLIDHYTVLENILCGAHLRLGYRMADQIFPGGTSVSTRRSWPARPRSSSTSWTLAGTARRSRLAPYGARKLVDIARAMVAGPRILSSMSHRQVSTITSAAPCRGCSARCGTSSGCNSRRRAPYGPGPGHRYPCRRNAGR